MSRVHILISKCILILFAIILPGCSALSSPRQIASYPLSTPYPRPMTTPAYDTYLELDVPDLEEVMERAARLAYRAGGMVVDACSWQQDGCDRTILVLAVPTGHSEALLRALLDLGTPLRQHTSSRMIGRYVEGASMYAYITIQFRESGGRLPALPPTGFRPLRTLAKAWRVFASITGFLVDILIWIAVVPGPFILSGLVVWRIVRHYRSRHVSRM